MKKLTVRSDVQLLKGLISDCHIELRVMEKMLSVPLISFSQEVEDDIVTKLRENNDSISANYMALSEMPFREYVFSFRDMYIYISAVVTDEKVTLKTVNMSDEVLSNFQNPYAGDIEYSNSDEEYVTITHHMPGDSELLDMCSGHTGRLIAIIVATMKIIEEGDLFPIMVKPVSPVKGINSSNPKKRLSAITRSAPKILFLNKLPNKSVSGKGSGACKAPHQRRGYKYTLRNERYSRHPLYKVENGMYKRPAWVGPTVTNYAGSTYTLIG